MAVPGLIKRCIGSLDIEYEVVNHPRSETLEDAAVLTGVPLSRIARAVVLKDAEGLLMVVLPVSHVLDFGSLRRLLDREYLELARPVDFMMLLDGCEQGSLLPLGAIYGMDTLVDGSLYSTDKVYFEPGIRTALICVSGAGFRSLHRNSMTGEIAYPIDALMDPDCSIDYTPDLEAQRRIEQIYDLPPIPDTARRLIGLRQKPGVYVDELVNVIEMEPGLADQVLRYANSPLFCDMGHQVTTVRDVIRKILGYDMVMNLSTGLALGRSFRNPVDGVLGQKAFWHHATYCAALAMKIAREMPLAIRPPSGMICLSGLLHNFGFLLLGHLFQPEFYLLNKLAAANPDISVAQLEEHVHGMGSAHNILCMGHGSIGAWLMQAWNMPEEVTASVLHHHHADYHGPHEIYVQLLMIANHVLRQYGIGDAHDGAFPVHALESLDLTEDQVMRIAEDVLSDSKDLNLIAQQMAA